MAKLLLFITITLNSVFLFSQISVDGIIYDDLKKESIQYAKVLISGTNSGVITNTDGYFKINHTKNDSLVISHILYPSVTISASYFDSQDTLFIQQGIQEIEEVIVLSSKNNIYDLLIASRKNLKKIKQSKSKAYLSFESFTDQTPLEMIQAYYNATINSNGPNELLLKNGRIGLSPNDDQYFVSLNTTKVLLGNKLLSSKHNVLPSSPLQISKRKLKKTYSIQFVSVENGLHKYHLVPDRSKNQEQFFEAYIYINKLQEEIHRIEFIRNGLKNMPFIPINEGDNLDSFNIQLTYNFDYSNSMKGLDNLEMKYDFIYQNKDLKRKINSECFLQFYDDGSLFTLPKGIYNSTSASDYEKITYQPYNDFFWTNNEIICPSKKDLENETFFKQNGVLMNFDSLKYDNDVLKNKILFWSNKRIFLDQINDEFGYNVRLSVIQDYHDLTTLSDHYSLKANLFLDQNTFKDSTQYTLKTIVNLDESFYHLEKNDNTTCFINMYFDLAEVYKRKLETSLNRQDWTKKQVDSLYENSITEMDIALKRYLKDVNHGKDELEILKYIDIIKNELGIDNSLLIESKEFSLVINRFKQKNFNEWIARYNYGSALMNIGDFEKALPILIETEEMGDTHPWLFYNIGVCYLELQQTDKACEYFNKSGTYGEKLEEEVKTLCIQN